MPAGCYSPGRAMRALAGAVRAVLARARFGRGAPPAAAAAAGPGTLLQWPQAVCC